LGLVIAVVIAAIGGPSSGRADDPVARDVAKLVGLNYPLRNTQYESIVSDLNGDGQADIVLNGHQRFDWPILRKSGAGFVRVQALPDRGDRHGCFVRDLNQDGRPDLYCVHGACEGQCTKEFPNELFLQQPDGRYSEVNSLASSADARTVAKQWGIADVHGRGRVPRYGDFNRDGRPDILVANEAPSIFPTPNRVFSNVGGRFVEVTNTPIRRESSSGCVDAGDTDGDGDGEAFFCSEGTFGILTYRNVSAIRGAINFQDITATTAYRNLRPRHIKVWDANGDGRFDLLIVEQKRFTIWLNQNGAFPAPSFSYPLSEGRHVAAGDVNLDGKQDIYIVQGLNSRYQDIMLIADVAGTSYHTKAIPQTTVGDGDAVTAYPNWNGTNRAAFLVMNGRLQKPGPVQFITFSP
jgi:hypothetical protein